MGLIPFTLPETEAWIGAETKASESPITCPTVTVSPFFTVGVQTPPICCCIGIVTIFGGSIKTLSYSAVFLLWGTLTPPLNFAIALVIVSIDKPPL